MFLMRCLVLMMQAKSKPNPSCTKNTTRIENIPPYSVVYKQGSILFRKIITQYTYNQHI